jgi:hypothetical protein
MRPTTLITLIYGILVFLNALMSFETETSTLIASLETLLASLFLINIYFMRYRKAFSEYIALIIALLLSSYYGVLFVTTTSFFPGVLALVGAFIIILHLVRILQINSTD